MVDSWRPLWDHHCYPVVSLTVVLEGEEGKVGDRWVAEVAEEAVAGPAEDPARLVYSTGVLQYHRLTAPVIPNATKAPDIHQSVQDHKNWHGYRGVTQSAAVSGASSATAASVGGVVPADWRTASRLAPKSVRCGHHQAAYGAQSLHSSVQNLPRTGTFLKSRNDAQNVVQHTATKANS